MLVLKGIFRGSLKRASENKIVFEATKLPRKILRFKGEENLIVLEVWGGVVFEISSRGFRGSRGLQREKRNIP